MATATAMDNRDVVHLKAVHDAARARKGATK